MSADPDRDAPLRTLAAEYVEQSGEYADPYEREKLIRDWLRKPAIAANVVEDFRRRAGEPSGARMLDLGFGNGLYAAAFARAGASVHGLEVSESLTAIARKICDSQGVSPVLDMYDGTTFPFGDGEFDHAYSISVIEHVSDPEMFLRETARVLKPGGAFYVTFPNRFSPRETHTGVYFLGYLPRAGAAWVMKTLYGRNTVAEINLHFLSFFSFMRMVRRSRCGLKLQFETESSSRINRLIKRSLRALGVHQGALLGHTMLVLRK